MLMDKQKLLEKAYAKFKEDFGVHHTDLGFNFTNVYKNSVIFGKNIDDIENYKKSKAVAIKGLTLCCIIALIPLVAVGIYLINIPEEIFLPTPWAITIVLLYLLGVIGNCYFYHKSKHYELLYKNDVFIYK